MWIAALFAAVATATTYAQSPTPVPQKSHQGPRSGVTVRKVPAPNSPQNMAAGEVAQAETAIDKKDYATAENLLKQAATHDPKSYRAFFDLGVLYSRMNRNPEAIDAYKKSIELNPQLFEANFNAGILLAQAGDASAETYLRAATKLKPTMGKPDEAAAAAWNALGQVLRNSKPKEAIAAFEQQAAVNPKDPSGHVLAAQVAEHSGDAATAQQQYEAAQAVDPKNVEAAAGVANLLMQSGQLDQAEQAIRKYIALAPSGPDLAKAHVQLGRILMKLHRRDEAIAEFEAAQKISPDAAPAESELAWMYLQDKQYDKAEAGFRALLQKSPKDADLHHGLGEALIPQKKFPEAQQELLQAVQLKPDLADAYTDLAFAASENKDYVLTVRALDARTNFLKETPGTLFLRATALDHLGAKDKAADSYREFLAASNGKFPDQEWQARHRLIAIQPNKK